MSKLTKYVLIAPSLALPVVLSYAKGKDAPMALTQRAGAWRVHSPHGLGVSAESTTLALGVEMIT